jgi:two-component system, cell cycle sensor histidine kinase and response regulator CckA
LAPELPAVAADESQIAQCVLNLCVNARDAMPNGGTLTVETETKVIDDLNRSIGSIFPAPGVYATIKVIDTGIGMDAETQKRIFEPFFTTKDAKGGSGFGLATVYGIVTNRGGHIDVSSEPGKGSSFTIVLPAEQEAVVKVVEQYKPVIEARKGAILVAEDDDTIRDFLSIVLTKAGYSVLLAEGGKQALELFREHKNQIDLVILDMIMPGMDGKETFEGLRNIAPNVRVLVSSGYSDESRSVKGAMGYLQKPYHLKGLLDAVDGAISAAE